MNEAYIDETYIEKNLIEETFKKAIEMADGNVEMENNEEEPSKNIKIIYPCYSNKTKRISEQEIKQLFIQTLIEDKKNNFYFSVETPTKLIYKFSKQDTEGKRTVILPLVGAGESANVDLCLYKLEESKFKRKHLIEFKANPPAEHEIKKDFLKLFLEEQEQLNNYFIHILDSANKGTLKAAHKLKDKGDKGDEKKSIIQKYYESWKYCTDPKEYNHGKYPSKNTITIYLLIIHNQIAIDKDKTGKKPSNAPAPSGYYKITLTPNKLTPNLLNPLTKDDWNPIH